MDKEPEGCATVLAYLLAIMTLVVFSAFLIGMFYRVLMWTIGN